MSETSTKHETRLRRERSIAYLLWSYVSLFVVVMLAGLGHGLLWPMMLWILLMLPGSVLFLLGLASGDPGLGETLGMGGVAVAPVLNLLLWRWWIRRRQRA